VCNTGEKHCNGNVPQICNDKHTGWVDAGPACSGATPVCQVDTGTCGCSGNTDCAGTPSTPICSGNKCVAPTCTEGQRECLDGVPQICHSNTWYPETVCAGTTPVCQSSTGQCGCSQSADCNGTPGTPICSNNQCVAATCTENQHECLNGVPQVCHNNAWTPEPACAAPTPVCMTSTGTCGCSGDGDCASSSPQTPFCNQSRHTCVACIFPSDCSGTRPVCDDGTCVACSSSKPCVAGTCQQDGSCLVLDGG
jgi:hypothetical protein